MKTPDRFERMVLHDLIRSEVIKLLRREHQWFREMVKRAVQPYRDSNDESPACYLAQDILDQLRQRQK